MALKKLHFHKFKAFCEELKDLFGTTETGKMQRKQLLDTPCKEFMNPALHTAAWMHRSQPEYSRSLLEAGANPSLKNKFGETFYDLQKLLWVFLELSTLHLPKQLHAWMMDGTITTDQYRIMSKRNVVELAVRICDPSSMTSSCNGHVASLHLVAKLDPKEVKAKPVAGQKPYISKFSKEVFAANGLLHLCCTADSASTLPPKTPTDLPDRRGTTSQSDEPLLENPIWPCEPDLLFSEDIAGKCLAFLQKHGTKGLCVLAGSSVQSTHLALAQGMPAVSDFLSHQLLDVSTFLNSARQAPASIGAAKKKNLPPKRLLENSHRAKPAVDCSVALVQHLQF
eukprot:CAMPEP_0175095400 /NCGR_PEP_ID=MMETSP0086_2-20121207/4133_1 /TAXON_ID=136419 /ORGANISM="Unknown Unknown, Strain D1" /LENGTH=338 /DNA_ID=CAMNT_0016368641 /DNA_START=385 /DNA_END=1401 /DNA_ORIENTATION=+